MYICPNCKKTSETPTNFCSLCGTPMVEQPTPQTEVQPTVSAAYTSQNPQPQYTENPQPPYPQYTQ
ncbi:MAG: hypothetical protein IJW89_04355, partial [Clostridia bacterium]|nr:hypothetical protein [Clostridia bacterium]